MINSELPLLKEQLMARFGCISFQLVLANMDVIGLRIKSTYEVVIITYRGADKVGFIYEGGDLCEGRVFNIFKDAPADKNDLEAYALRYADKIDVLQMPKNNYVFVNDKEVRRLKK